MRRAITLGAWGLKASGSPGLPSHKANAGHQSNKAVMDQQQAAPAGGPPEQQDGSSDSDKESEGASEGEGPSGNVAGSSRQRLALDSRPHSLEQAARLFMQRITARRVLQVSSSAKVRLPLHGTWCDWNQGQRAALEPHQLLLLTAHSACRNPGNATPVPAAP